MSMNFDQLLNIRERMVISSMLARGLVTYATVQGGRRFDPVMPSPRNSFLEWCVCSLSMLVGIMIYINRCLLSVVYI